MKWIVLIVLASLQNASTNKPPQDGSKVREGRIVGGKRASEGEFPFIVSLLCRGIHMYCAGTIIDKEWVLTAAHCMLACPMGDMKIRAGSNNWHQGGTLHNVFTMISHPEFGNTAHRQPFNDIGLIKVYPPFIENNKTLRRVPLSENNNETLIGYKATVAGWGYITPRGLISLHLLKANLPILHRRYCEYHFEMPENQICAGSLTGTVDSCKGDSGGPLLINGTQYGIVSWGFGCAIPHNPGVYTDVASHRSWMRKYSGV